MPLTRFSCFIWPFDSRGFANRVDPSADEEDAAPVPADDWVEMLAARWQVRRGLSMSVPLLHQMEMDAGFCFGC